jgi:hypothetical protein
MPYLAFDFDPRASTFVGVADVLVIDLNRIDGLNKICVFTMDVNQVTDIDLTIGQFNDPDVYSRIIVNDTADNRFSYANSHAKPPILKSCFDTFMGDISQKTQGLCRAGNFKGGGSV